MIVIIANIKKFNCDINCLKYIIIERSIASTSKPDKQKY